MKLSLILIAVVALVLASIGCAPSASTSSPAGPSLPEPQPQWKGVMESEKGGQREVLVFIEEEEASVSGVAASISAKFEIEGVGPGPVRVEGVQRDFVDEFGISTRRWDFISLEYRASERFLKFIGQEECGECGIMRGRYELVWGAMEKEKGTWQMQAVNK